MYRDEHFDKQEHWTTPELQVEAHKLGRMTLTCFNSTVFLFGNGYEHMNHLWHVDETGQGYRFTGEQLLENVLEQDFPRIYLPYPTANELDAYVRSEMMTMDAEIETL